MKYFLLLVFLLISTPFGLIGCSSSIRYEKQDDERVTQNQNHEQQIPDSDEVLETKEGTASYYSTKFHGKKTSSGETYNMNDFTAAHLTYPFGTIVKITNLKNKKTTTVKINDRPPKSTKRIIDMSYAAAKELGMIKSGIAKVKLEVLKWGE